MRRAAALAALALLALGAFAGTASATPVAGFTFSPTVPEVGADVHFTGATDSAAGPLTYAWDFGDGAHATGREPHHAYGSPGDKTVTMTVTAGDGTTDAKSQTVHVNFPPTAKFVFAAVINPPTGQDPFTPLIGQDVAFTAYSRSYAGVETLSSDPDGTIARYQWDLGDGNFVEFTGNPQIPPYTPYPFPRFPAAGSRTVRLRVTDANGATAAAQATFRVNTPPVAGFTFAPGTPNPNELVNFDSTSSDPDGSGDLDAVRWEFNGDNKFDDATGPRAQAIYTAPGDYTVGLKVTDKGRAPATVFRTVSIAGPPAPRPNLPPGDTTTIVGAGSPAASGGGAGAGPASGGGSRASFKVMRSARVQVGGTVNGALTSFTQFVVVAPRGAVVTATCNGQGCPLRAVRRKVGASRRVRLRELERTLGAGARITVTIRRAGYLTKRARFTVRRWQPPKRVEGCVAPDTGKPTRCGA